MDIEGWSPSAKCGRYFGASLRTWIAVFYAIKDLCGDLVDEPLLWAMADGEGAGPRDQETCSEMAKRFEKILGQNPDGLEVAIPADDVEADASPETFRADREVVLRWTRFLRHCGGFEVWR